VSDLAVYDMDRTVTRRATYTPFLLHCAVQRAPWRLIFLPLVILSMLAYVARLIDRGELKEISHRLLLGHRVHLSELKPLVESFADAQVAKNIRRGARIAIARDKKEGRRLVLATASYRLYADAIAERLGFDDVIGTGSVIGLDERVHAKIGGENCYGPAKMRMIADWVEASGLKDAHGHVRFYSDHVSDRPAFEWSDEPVAVNPHARLRRLAEERGWTIEDWGLRLSTPGDGE
jgi:HAD superfamily hydrolase (TIGR01490 family)